MSFDKNGFPDDEAYKLYRWWEDKIDGDTRHSLMLGYKWGGSPQERLEKLKEMHSTWLFINSKSKRTGV